MEDKAMTFNLPRSMRGMKTLAEDMGADLFFEALHGVLGEAGGRSEAFVNGLFAEMRRVKKAAEAKPEAVVVEAKPEAVVVRAQRETFTGEAKVCGPTPQILANIAKANEVRALRAQRRAARDPRRTWRPGHRAA